MAAPALRPTRTKHPDGIAALTFEFLPKLAPDTKLEGQPVVEARGLELVGEPVIKGSTVVQRVGGGVLGNAYTVKCHAPTCSGERHTIEMVLLIRADT